MNFDFFFSSFLFMIFTVNAIIFGKDAKIMSFVEIITNKNMDVKLLHLMWRDFLDTVNSVVQYSPSSIFLIHKFIDGCIWKHFRCCTY